MKNNDKNTPQILLWIRRLDLFNLKFGETCSWLIIVLLIGVFLSVVLRYLFALDVIWLQELMIYVHALFFISVAGYTLQFNAHVRVDVFYQKFGPRIQSVVNVLGTCLLLIPVYLLLLNDSWFFFYDSVIILEGSQMTGGLPTLYIFKFFLLILPVVLIVQGISQVLKSILIFQGKEWLLESKKSNERSALENSNNG